ncbi:MAG: MFS transporter [Rickettsiaceae bacterium]|nr:MFS transporter [Rickettsiaceae bacterium]
MRKIVISGMIGNALEWYDYALYAQFAYIIGMKFFPESEIREILTFAVFAAGFVVRPLGGVVFGNIGDRIGRRTALVIGILTMAVPTAGIGLLPSYEYIGLAAPIILTLIRLIQGFSLGGEFSGCIAYMVEHSPPEKRGLTGSASFVSMCLGMLLGYAVARIFKYALSEEDLLSWGWRIPFVLGVVIGLVGLYIRMHLSESPIYKAAKASGSLSRTPLRETFTEYWREVFMAVVVYINVTAPFYTTTVYMKHYMETLGYQKNQADLVSSLILVTMTVMFPIAAYISDKIGRKPVIIASNVLLVVSIYPIFLALQSMDYTLAILSQILFAAIVGVYMGPVPTLLVELFPTRVRFTGVAISYNLSAAIFGGTLPMVGAILYKYTGDELAISYYLTGLALFGLLIISFYKETFRYNLTDDITHEESFGDEEALETY